VTCIHIVPGPTQEIARQPDERETRWCFGCRKHLTHEWVCYTDPPERQPSYYDPIWVLECSRCGKDRTRFPGTDWA
jgi:hypothetical protein